MVVLRLFAGLAFMVLLSGCHLYSAPENIEKLKADIRLLKTYYRASPPATVCQPPGTPQSRICNYRLVVKHMHDDYYQGHVDPALVAEGVQACKEYVDEYKAIQLITARMGRKYPNIDTIKGKRCETTRGVATFENVLHLNLKLVDEIMMPLRSVPELISISLTKRWGL